MADSDMLRLLQMRLLVGFLGERSQFAWWPTSFFGDYSLQSLEFISPKTALLAQYHGVVEAARKLHDEHLDVGSYHLFRLPEEVEQDLHAVLQTQPGATLSLDMELNPEMALLALRAMGGARPFADLVFFRNSIGVQYRMEGTRCSVFYHMSDTEDGRFDSQLDEAKGYGFANVDWEDRGAHGTIFDDYDTLEHFERLEAFRRGIAPLLRGGVDQASELIFLLEDLNPRIVWTLAAAFTALGKAETEEDVAQASLSGRRFIEQLADVLFPPKRAPKGERPLGKQNYRNRIWAYLSEHSSPDEMRTYGDELDRLDEEFNAGLHGTRDKPRLEQAFTDLAVLTTAVLAVDPSAARNPYYAHRDRMLELFRNHL